MLIYLKSGLPRVCSPSWRSVGQLQRDAFIQLTWSCWLDFFLTLRNFSTFFIFNHNCLQPAATPTPTPKPWQTEARDTSLRFEPQASFSFFIQAVSLTFFVNRCFGCHSYRHKQQTGSRDATMRLEPHVTITFNHNCLQPAATPHQLQNQRLETRRCVSSLRQVFLSLFKRFH